MTPRELSAQQLAKMQAGAKAWREAKKAETRYCGDCGRKVKPLEGKERYIESSTRPGVVYCLPGTGCWIKPTGKRRTRAEL